MIKLTLKNVGEQKCCHPFLIFSPEDPYTPFESYKESKLRGIRR